VPLQFDDVELLFAALTPFEQGLATLRGTPLPTTCPEGVPAASTLTHCGQMGSFGLNEKVQGWDLYETWQAQFTATKSFSNVLAASQLVLVFEGGVTHIPDLPDKLTGGPNDSAQSSKICVSAPREPQRSPSWPMASPYETSSSSTRGRLGSSSKLART
jgi:hypothetical protein